MSKLYHRLATLLGVATLGVSAQAAVITTSASAPSGSIISQPDFSAGAFDGGKDFTDNGGPPGQTFTTTQAFSLNSVTVKGFANDGGSFGGAVATQPWTITISRVNNDNTLTRLDQESADASAVTDGSAYVTFALSSAVNLNAGTKYAFDVYSGTGYFGLAKSSTDVLTGGEAFQHGTTARTSADGALIANIQNVDRTFFLGGTVPEPTSLGVIGILGAGALARRRR